MIAKFTAVVKCRCYSDLWKVWHRWDPLYILSGAHFFQGQRRNVSYPRPHDGATRKRKALALQQVRLQKWQNGLILSALQETPQSLKNCWPSNDDACKWHYIKITCNFEYEGSARTLRPSLLDLTAFSCRTYLTFVNFWYIITDLFPLFAVCLHGARFTSCVL